MAAIGLAKPYYAIYSNSGTTVSYASGASLGKAISVDLTINEASNNDLYADNTIAESDNQFSGGQIKVKTANLDATVAAAILGITQESIATPGTTGAKWNLFNDSQNTPYVGIGGVIKHKVNGSIKYEAFILNKVMFKNPGRTINTQGETIEWQTPEITATILRNDAASHEWYRFTTLLDSESEAEGYVKTFLSIT